MKRDETRGNAPKTNAPETLDDAWLSRASGGLTVNQRRQSVYEWAVWLSELCYAYTHNPPK
jgi:hypothetical protein